MCGVFGIASSHLDISKLTGLGDVLQHRGPDDKGQVLLDDSIFLSHTRLSILDLSENGRQPMGNSNETVWIIHNGEIYNYCELREELEGRGYRFKSKTDTEVILHGYEEWGEEVLQRLNGMFAFGIYDRGRNRFLLARDRLGIKPLYYGSVNGTFVFASEIKALLATDFFRKEINWQALYDYFSFLYIPHPDTIFEEIRQLSPGHLLIYDLDSGNAKIKQYWDLVGFIGSAPSPNSPFDAISEELRFLLTDSVKKRLISDVPLGAFMSGGIDSTILTALMAQSQSEVVKTFTVLFEGDGIRPYDETVYARRVSRQFTTDHHEIVVDISEPGELFELIRCFDQPFANPTFYLSYLIARETRREVTVALSGAGGDELFGGYPRYRVLNLSGLIGAVPAGWARPLAQLLRWFPENHNDPTIRRVKLLARGVGQPFPEQYLRWAYYFSDEEKNRLLRPLLGDVGPLLPSVRIIERYLKELPQAWGLPARVQYLDLKTFLLDNILEYTDKTSMAVGLEVRVPFLDHRLVEFSFSIPWRYKLRNGQAKYILKETFRDLIPSENRSTPKRGFCPPLAVWMERTLDAYFDEVLTKEAVEQQGIFDWREIQSLREEHRRRSRDTSMELFGIIMFDVWYRSYILNGSSG